MAVAGPATALISVSELARQRGRDKALISRQVAKLEEAGKLKTHVGPRGAKLVDPAEFERAIAAVSDAVKEQAAATVRLVKTERVDSPAASPPPHGAPDEATTFSAAQRAKIYYESELRKLDLAERRGQVVPIADVVAALRQAGDAAVQLIDRLPLRSADVAEAMSKNGEAGVRALLKGIAFELRTGIAAAFTKLEAEGKAEEAAGALVADLPDETA